LQQDPTNEESTNNKNAGTMQTERNASRLFFSALDFVSTLLDLSLDKVIAFGNYGKDINFVFSRQVVLCAIAFTE
jgi:hypothetical protein